MARGPAYPYIDLETAVALATKMYEYTKRSMAPLDSVIKEAWNYSPTSSSGIKVFAAMKYFGLVEANDTNDALKITDRAYRIIVDDPESEERQESLQEAALSPKWYRFCWEEWGTEMPPSMKRTLIFHQGFVETTVDGFLRDYKKSIDYAGLAKRRSVKSPTGVVSEDESNYIGDSQRGVESQKEADKEKAAPPKESNMRNEVFSLTEGTVSVEWPGDLSHESFQDLSDWLDILKRKIGRAAKISRSGADGDEEKGN